MRQNVKQFPSLSKKSNTLHVNTLGNVVESLETLENDEVASTFDDVIAKAM